MPLALTTECILPSANGLGEVPQWHPETQTLWWCDVKVPAMVSYQPASGDSKTYPVEGKRIGSWAFMVSGGMLLAQEDGLYAWSPDSGKRTLLRHVTSSWPNARLNDGRCDRKGRFWVGSMSETYREAPVGVFYRFDADFTLIPVFSEFTVPNSVTFSPDDRRMYFADSLIRKIFLFDFDLSEGRLWNKRLFRDCADAPGNPDGSTVDVDGCLWNAEFQGSRVVRYTPDGQVDTVIELPVSQPTSCAFGGKDLDILYITTGAQNLTEAQRAQQPLAGGIFALRPGTQGLPEQHFGP